MTRALRSIIIDQPQDVIRLQSRLLFETILKATNSMLYIMSTMSSTPTIAAGPGEPEEAQAHSRRRQPLSQPTPRVSEAAGKPAFPSRTTTPTKTTTLTRSPRPYGTLPKSWKMTPQTPQRSVGDRPTSAAGSRRGSVSSSTSRFRASSSGLPRPASSLRESRVRNKVLVACISNCYSKLTEARFS